MNNIRHCHPTDRVGNTTATFRVLLGGRGQVKTVQVHHFIPGSDEVLDKLPVRV
jgi:hypothetical protein